MDSFTERPMPDPTYALAEIEADPVWAFAFALSEVMNDTAPLGWSRYIFVAECLLERYDITRKKGKA